MGGEGSVHCRADHSEVVLLLDHELFERLHGRFLLTSFGIDDVLGIVIGAATSTTFAFGRVHRRIRTALFFGQAEIYQVDEVGLVRVVADDHVGGLQVSVDVALGVDARQAVHELQGNNDNGLDLEFAFFERFFQLLQVDAQQLHDQVVVILVRAIRVQARKANPPVFRNGLHIPRRILLLLLLLL